MWQRGLHTSTYPVPKITGFVTATCLSHGDLLPIMDNHHRSRSIYESQLNNKPANYHTFPYSIRKRTNITYYHIIYQYINTNYINISNYINIINYQYTNLLDNNTTVATILLLLFPQQSSLETSIMASPLAACRSPSTAWRESGLKRRATPGQIWQKHQQIKKNSK